MCEVEQHDFFENLRETQSKTTPNDQKEESNKKELIETGQTAKDILNSNSQVKDTITNNQQHTQNTQTEIEKTKLNDLLEQKYRSKQYGVILCGSNIHEFNNYIHDRLEEVRRCFKIKDPLLIQPIELEFFTQLKILVDNFEDYTVIGQGCL